VEGDFDFVQSLSHGWGFWLSIAEAMRVGVVESKTRGAPYVGFLPRRLGLSIDPVGTGVVWSS
jgi:hypothetical protein